MIHEQIEGFTEGLIEKTKEQKLKWMPLSYFHKMRDINEEFDAGFAGIDFGVNSIRERNSFFLKSKEGYVFLFEIYHGDPDVTSPELDSLQLMVKINKVLPIDNLSRYVDSEEHQNKLEVLKLLIESYIEEQYNMPEALYKFMEQVLTEDTEVIDCGNEDEN